MLEAYLEMPEVRAVNFGNPERYEPDQVLPAVLRAGKVYFGSFPRRPGEGLDAYFDRMPAPLGGEKCGLLLVAPRDQPLPATDEAMARWHEAQERAAR